MKFPLLKQIAVILILIVSNNTAQASNTLTAQMIGGWLFTKGNAGKTSPMLATTNVPGPTARAIMIAEFASLPMRDIAVPGIAPEEAKLLWRQPDFTSLTLTCSKSVNKFSVVVFANTLITVPAQEIAKNTVGLEIRIAKNDSPLIAFTGAARGDWSARRRAQLQDFTLSDGGSHSPAHFLIQLRVPAATLSTLRGKRTILIDIAAARNPFSFRKNTVLAGRTGMRFDTSQSKPAITAFANACGNYVSLISGK